MIKKKFSLSLVYLPRKFFLNLLNRKFANFLIIKFIIDIKLINKKRKRNVVECKEKKEKKRRPPAN